MSDFFTHGHGPSARLFYLLIISASLFLSACSKESDYSSPVSVRSVATVFNLSGDPTTGRILPDISDPKAQLGMKLFFTKGLGGDQDTACASCHHPALGGGDELSLSIGVGAVNPDLVGPGRAHPSGVPTVPRNAQTTFNIGMYDQVLFHDGRIESLNKIAGFNGADNPDDDLGDLGIRTPETGLDANNAFIADPNAGPNLPAAQARFPVTSPEQMRGFTFVSGGTNDDVRTALVTQLITLGAGAWEAEFQAAFGDATITYNRIAEAIGEYERSQVFVNTPWRAFLEGDDNAISEAARRGAILFYFPAFSDGANCVACHKGDFFTDEQFHVLGMPQVGAGKGDGVNGTDDFGRFRETATDAQKYAFRTPSLLNVSETGPWGHAGGYTTLESVVRHHLSPQTAIDNYDFSQLDPAVPVADMKANTQKALDQLAANNAAGIFSIRDVALTDEEVADLVEFLKTLTDPCIKDRNCIAPWVPDGTVSDPDGLRLNAVDSLGNPL